MGGTGGGPFVSRSPSKLQDLVRRKEEQTKSAVFMTELAGTLANLLGSYNARDTEAVRDRLDELKSALQETSEGTLDQLFGGSVAKHTYVDGLSDIDSLVLISDSSLADKSPDQVLDQMDQVLSRKMGAAASVSHGRMAVTVEYGDGMVIQLLPTVRTEGGQLRVPSSRRQGEWSNIDPVPFQKALARRNAECGGKLVPTIKLAKAIVGQLPESQRLSGYHMEALGIAAFRSYEGPKTTAAMLPAFFDRSTELVLQPIKDQTGQSVHVDGYLGDSNSEQRKAASHLLGRLARRMRNATAAESTAQWRAMFGLEQ